MRDDLEIFRLQCKAARALLEWNQARLAEEANVAKQTVADFERRARTPIPNNLRAIRAALESAGISFVDDIDGFGVEMNATMGDR